MDTFEEKRSKKTRKRYAQALLFLLMSGLCALGSATDSAFGLWLGVVSCGFLVLVIHSCIEANSK